MCCTMNHKDLVATVTEGSGSDIKTSVLLLTLPGNSVWGTCHFGSHVAIYRMRWLVRKSLK